MKTRCDTERHAEAPPGGTQSRRSYMIDVGMLLFLALLALVFITAGPA